MATKTFFWEGLHNLGLPANYGNVLHGFLPDKLKNRFAGVSISLLEDSVIFEEARSDNGISQGVISKHFQLLLQYLTELMCTQFSQASKRSRSIGLKKGSVPFLPLDFHSIWLLSFLSKVLAKITNGQIGAFLARKALLYRHLGWNFGIWVAPVVILLFRCLQCLLLNTAISTTRETSSGIPQCLVFGSLLLFVNDLQQQLVDNAAF